MVNNYFCDITQPVVLDTGSADNVAARLDDRELLPSPLPIPGWRATWSTEKDVKKACRFTTAGLLAVSADKHGVSEGEEAVFLLHRLLVGGQDVLPARQGGHQHDEGGLGQVEVGDKAVQHLELVAWVDEDIGPPGALL